MRKLLKTELIKHLDELAFLGEMLDWNTFKVRAYRSAIDALEAVEDDELPGRVQDKSLLEIKGIGKGILAIAQSVAAKGTSDEFVAASSELPLSLLELRGLSGLGPKKIRVLHDEIGVTNLGELEYACEENRLVNLKGFGAKTQEKIREQIQTLKSNQGKFILSDALEFTDHFVKKAGAKTPLIPVGEVATKEPIVHVLDFLLIKTAKLAKENAEKEEAYLRKLAGAPSTKESADRLIEMKTKEGVQIRFEVCDSKVAGVRQVVRTSSESHWKSLEKKAASLNINLETLHCTSDVVLYEKLALPFYHPEERSQPARSDHRSLKVSDLTGVFHLHTTESDGVNTLQEMAEAAYERGWSLWD